MSKKLAIKSDMWNADGVIKLLEMMGGVNKYKASGKAYDAKYIINPRNGNAIEKAKDYDYMTYDAFYLNDFEMLYPFKVGDNVKISNDGTTTQITKMEWDRYNETIIYTCYINDEVKHFTSGELIQWNHYPDFKFNSFIKKKK